MGAILTLNAGSSSVKFAGFSVRNESRLERIVAGEVKSLNSLPKFEALSASGEVLASEAWPDATDHAAAMAKILTWAETHLGADPILAVGHRVVHGGATHIEPEIVSATLIKDLEALTPLAPLHEPYNLDPMRTIASERPELVQVACFDTAFHHTMPDIARRIAIPRKYEAAGVRRYGFHGLSYEHLSSRLRELSPNVAAGRVVGAHLGSGASLCAMREGRSVETTMGFTALDGLMMGSRCGSLDPGVMLYLQQQEGMNVSQVENLLYYQSGLLGVSGGQSSDMRTLLASSTTEAREAVDLFVYRIVREAGSMISTLGGLNGFVFTGGIGEHAPEIRRRVCQQLVWIGIAVDDEANERGDALISAPTSRVEIRIIPADEERVIAEKTLAALRSTRGARA